MVFFIKGMVCSELKVVTVLILYKDIFYYNTSLYLGTYLI
jgi:hypothetical protein